MRRDIDEDGLACEPPIVDADETKEFQAEDRARHYTNSVLRERIVEHVFVGEALRRLWQRGVTDVEVLRAEFDAGGYDLVMSRGTVLVQICEPVKKRHIGMDTLSI